MLNQSRPDLKIPKESRFLELGMMPSLHGTKIIAAVVLSLCRHILN